MRKAPKGTSQVEEGDWPAPAGLCVADLALESWVAGARFRRAVDVGCSQEAAREEGLRLRRKSFGSSTDHWKLQSPMTGILSDAEAKGLESGVRAESQVDRIYRSLLISINRISCLSVRKILRDARSLGRKDAQVMRCFQTLVGT